MVLHLNLESQHTFDQQKTILMLSNGYSGTLRARNLPNPVRKPVLTSLARVVRTIYINTVIHHDTLFLCPYDKVHCMRTPKLLIPVKGNVMAFNTSIKVYLYTPLSYIITSKLEARVSRYQTEWILVQKSSLCCKTHNQYEMENTEIYACKDYRTKKFTKFN